MDISGANLVGGEAVVGNGTSFHAVNPASGAPLEPAFHEAGRQQVHRAFEIAEHAFHTFGEWEAPRRARLLRTIASAIEDLGETLIGRAHEETALPVSRLEGERLRTVGQLRLLASYIEDGAWLEARIDTGDPQRTPTPKPDLRRMMVPLGPVAIFGASNFPLAFSVPGGDTAAALAAGCSVVFKAHPAHPGTSELAARAIEKAVREEGAPAGVFSLLHGWSHDVGLAMVRHPLARAVGFTGSLAAGRALFDAAAARPEPIPVYAEMGSVNPVFLLPSAVAERGERIADGLAQSVTLGVGQFCTNPGVVVATRGPHTDALRDRLAGLLRGIAPGVMLYERLGETYVSALERIREKGVAMITGVADVGSSRALARPALLTTDVEHFVEDAELRSEIFGPACLLVTGKDVSDLERAAEALEGQLAASIHGSHEELRTHARLVQTLRRKVGRLIFNGFPTGVEVGHAIQHGGPYPAATDSRSTSVGTASIVRFTRPVCYQNFPDAALPPALRNRNALGIWRLINGHLTRADA